MRKAAMKPMQIVDFSKPYVIDVDGSESTIMQQSRWNGSAGKHVCNEQTSSNAMRKFWTFCRATRYYSASRWHSGDVMVGNITFLMIFAVFWSVAVNTIIVKKT